MSTFKQMIKSGAIKRADAMKVRLDDIRVEDGFNLRHDNADLNQSINDLADHIMQGGQIPPLEVRPDGFGKVFVVDGHRRREAIRLAVAQGAPLADENGDIWVPVIAFVGDDADRVARVITSAEGRPLSPLETAEGYKRLRAFQWDVARIARTVGRSPQYVADLLELADAPREIQIMVMHGTVSASTAIDLIRKHGFDAAEVLHAEADKAKKQGKDRVTPGTINGKALPRKVVNAVISSLDSFVTDLPVAARLRLESIEAEVRSGRLPEGQQISVPVAALLALLKAHGGIKDARDTQAQKTRERENKAAQTELAA